MKSQILEIKTALQIQKPVNEVFEAIVDPVKMSNYFISRSSGKMEEGKQIRWKFPEFEYVPSASIEVRPIKTKEEQTRFVYPK